MQDPFKNRALSLSGPASDILPVTPSDTADLPEVAAALFIQTSGALTVTTVRGQVRTLSVPEMSILPVGVRRVHASGTTADGIHALLV